MKSLIAILLLMASSALAVEPIPVIMYHKITAAEPPSDLVTSPQVFKAHIDAIKGAGYSTITVGQLAEHMRGERTLPQRSVVITFDDGWRDNLAAAQQLQARGMVATFFVMSGVWDNRAYLSRAEVRAISAHHEIGAHTHTHFMEWHDRLNEMDDRIMVGEIAMSKIILEEVIGKPVRSFAWPFGYSREHLNKHLAGLGITAAAHVNVDSNNAVGGNPLNIHRLTVNGNCSAAQLIQLIETRKLGACK